MDLRNIWCVYTVYWQDARIHVPKAAYFRIISERDNILPKYFGVFLRSLISCLKEHRPLCYFWNTLRQKTIPTKKVTTNVSQIIGCLGTCEPKNAYVFKCKNMASPLQMNWIKLNDRRAYWDFLKTSNKICIA